MKAFNRLIHIYLLKSVLPYFLFIWILLSVVLFVQQSGRYSELLFSINLPPALVWQLTLALIPSVISFTCPMAVLLAVIIGLSKMQGDSELTAIRAAGVGNWRITAPFAVLGIALSVFAVFVNLNGVPLAAKIVRSIAIQAAIYKLESPIEPGVFNTEINGYTIYVKNGDIEQGKWENIFIYNEDPVNGTVRLITSKAGRIDSNDDSSELVLENALVTTVQDKGSEQKYISENLGQLRFAVQTGRSNLITKMSGSEQTPEELGLTELYQYAAQKTGSEKIEAQILWLRRIILSISPLIFALLGAVLVLRFNRGGRGFGIFLALVSLVAYYLITLIGEQLARTNLVSPLAGSLLPVAVASAAIIWFYYSNKIFADVVFKRRFGFSFSNSKSLSSKLNVFSAKKYQLKSFQPGIGSRILDTDIVYSLIKYLLLTLGFLGSIYLIFTAFELWKFAAMFDGGVALLGKYLLYLIPFIYIQLAPPALMVAILATYVIKSRQNEVVTWIAAGQSVFRLLLPCFVLTLLIGVINWELQERLLPRANQTQDALRAQIRSRGKVGKFGTKFWVASENRIFSFELGKTENYSAQKVHQLTVYQFDDKGSQLQSIYEVPEAVWEYNKIKFTGEVSRKILNDGKFIKQTQTGGELTEKANPFNNITTKPAHLNTDNIREEIAVTESVSEKRNFEVALNKKYTTIILPFIIAIFTSPFALSLSRKGKVVTIGYAIGVWLTYMGISGVFEQLGANGRITPFVAVWSPLLLFTMIGVYLLSRAKT